MDWDTMFINMCHVVAAKSKDPSCKVGCVIVGPDHEVRSIGYNGFPRGADDSGHLYANRETKLLRAEHAERNAIYNAARVGIPLDGCTLYVTCVPQSMPPCAACARAIIQSGIVEVVMPKEASIPERWAKECAEALLLFKECQIEVRTC